MVDRRTALEWIAAYEAAWRSDGTAALVDVFTSDVTYRPSPWASALHGLDALERFWESERAGSDEPFELTGEVVAVDDPVAIIRVEVAYGDGERWRDLWIVTFDADGRCHAFEEWPFAPDQPDGH
jgi:ketosteroid isomerase-like protein